MSKYNYWTTLSTLDWNFFRIRQIIDEQTGVNAFI